MLIQPIGDKLASKKGDEFTNNSIRLSKPCGLSKLEYTQLISLFNKT